MSKKPSLSQLILTFFMQHPHQDLSHDAWIDTISEQYKALYGQMPRDPWRATRKLYQDGYLIKVGNGIYRYDPEQLEKRHLEDFSPEQKQIILARDNFRCVICGRGAAEGLTLHVDHIKPKQLGGQAILENGQTLCAQHNFLKKTYQQTETGKRLFIRLYELAQKEGDETLLHISIKLRNRRDQKLESSGSRFSFLDFATRELRENVLKSKDKSCKIP